MTGTTIGFQADFEPAERAEMILAFDAVCFELGLSPDEQTRRDAIATRIATTWRQGPRHPLNLVNAGLDAACA